MGLNAAAAKDFATAIGANKSKDHRNKKDTKAASEFKAESFLSFNLLEKLSNAF